MPKIPLAAAAALALLTVAAAAQTTPSSPNGPRPPTPGATTSPAPVQRAPAINPLTKEDVSAIEGTTVYNGDEKLGHISTVLMDPQSKKIDRLVVTAGGVLGVGGHRVAIPLDQFKWNGDKGVFTLSMTTASLKKMPEWVEGATTSTGSSQAPTKPLNSAGDGDKGDKTAK
jgi:opacity protein-like surface antigen